MIKNIFEDHGSVKEYINEKLYIKISLYIAGGIVLIWVLGKASLLLTDAAKNFKSFCREF